MNTETAILLSSALLPSAGHCRETRSPTLLSLSSTLQPALPAPMVCAGIFPPLNASRSGTSYMADSFQIPERIFYEKPRALEKSLLNVHLHTQSPDWLGHSSSRNQLCKSHGRCLSSIRWLRPHAALGTSTVMHQREFRGELR